MQPRRARACASHTIPDRPPLHVRPGDAVVAGARDTQWPAFAFVTAADGSGWVPARFLSSDPGDAVVLEPYDTTELPVVEGEVVSVLVEDVESGWLWCRNAAGREGWVPMKVLAAEEA